MMICKECGGPQYRVGKGFVGIKLAAGPFIVKCLRCGKQENLDAEGEIMKYIGTKIINAVPAIAPDTVKGNNMPGDAGYEVTYPDGYVSWSPKAAFEEAYQANGQMSFGHALVAMKAGSRVSRDGWNGKDMWLILVDADEYDMESYKMFNSTGLLPFIAMKTATGEIVPWLCSQTDALAEDWEVIG